MTDPQWNELLDVVAGRPTGRVPVGFIIDSPWLPGWFGCRTVEFIARQDLWFAAHRRAAEVFPECTFLPGFWSEFGMCTEPSAFGAPMRFPPDEFPFAGTCLESIEQADSLPDPDPECDGLLPFMLQRLKWAEPKLADLGMKVRFSVSRGPLNIARPVQGRPVIVQAGASEAGKQLAAETAEMVFCSFRAMEDGKEFYRDVKGRMLAAGRNPDHMKILPGALVVVGESEQEAREKRALLDSLVHYDSGIGSLSIALGCDARGFDPDGPLHEDLPPTQASLSGRERVLRLAEREGLTVRELAGRLGGYAGLSFVGTPTQIADEIETWLMEGASDGFNIMFPYLPAGLDDFVDTVVPELQRRGIFRREYEGRTLRENLGVPRPKNRFFPA